MTLTQLAGALNERLEPALFDRFEGRVLLRCQLPSQRSATAEEAAQRLLSLEAQAAIDLGFELSAGCFHWHPQRRADAVFYFESADAAFALLTGAADPMQAFSAGTLRASGYLVWTPVVLGLFRGRPEAS
ncbi:MAG: hypothetical protein AAGI15_10650 [Pseudomonadota bacterium]